MNKTSSSLCSVKVAATVTNHRNRNVQNDRLFFQTKHQCMVEAPCQEQPCQFYVLTLKHQGPKPRRRDVTSISLELARSVAASVRCLYPSKLVWPGFQPYNYTWVTNKNSVIPPFVGDNIQHLMAVVLNYYYCRNNPAHNTHFRE